MAGQSHKARHLLRSQLDVAVCDKATFGSTGHWEAEVPSEDHSWLWNTAHWWKETLEKEDHSGESGMRIWWRSTQMPVPQTLSKTPKNT